MTYREIQKRFKEITGVVCVGCWIADRKNALGFITKPSVRRGPDYPKYSCPLQHQELIDKLIMSDDTAPAIAIQKKKIKRY